MGGHEERRALMGELRGFVWDAARCPCANFVLQKGIETSQLEDLQFIIDELARPRLAVRAAMHRCACRVLQRLVERCAAWQVRGLMSAVLESFDEVVRNPYGNYVVQHLAEHGCQDLRRRVMLCAARDVKGLAADPFGAAALKGLLSKGPACEQEIVAQAMLNEAGLLVFLACSRHGHGAVQRALLVLKGAERAQARKLFLEEKGCLQASRFGRQILHAL